MRCENLSRDKKISIPGRIMEVSAKVGLRGLHRAEKPATRVSLVQRILNRSLARHAD